MKKIYYKVVPFFSSILLGVILLYISFCVSEKFQNFVQGISASLIAIPFVFWGYEFVRNISQKKLKRELFELAKMQIDTELLGILHVFYKIFFPLNTGTDLILLERMIHTKREALCRHLSTNKFLGFQVKKSFIITLQKIDAILQNGYFLKYIDDDQILALVKLHKTINSWNAFISKMHNEECFLCSGESTDEYRIVSSGEKSNRLLLLKKKSETTGIVCDFGDFEKVDDEKLLHFYTIDPDILQLYTGYIADIFENIADWIKLTGKEFLMDPQEFRFRDATCDKES